MKQPLHMLWREQYRNNRYLIAKPESHIVARMRYQIEAILTLTETGQIGPESPEGLGLWMWARFTHTQHEFELRGRRPTDGFLKGASIPRVTYPDTPLEKTAYERRSRLDRGQLFKFGKARWMRMLVESGSLRFCGAAYYKDSSLNSAIKDDELSFTFYPAGRLVDLAKIGIRGYPSGAVPGGLILSHPTDYYVQCFSTRYAMRMFKDFEADACVVVYDGREFGRRVLKGLRSKFPDWLVGAFPVTYVDPDDPIERPLPIPAVKHMRYAYQAEERIICHPKSGVVQSLAPFNLEIGSLMDIAELIVI